MRDGIKGLITLGTIMVSLLESVVFFPQTEASGSQVG